MFQRGEKNGIRFMMHNISSKSILKKTLCFSSRLQCLSNLHLQLPGSALDTHSQTTETASWVISGIFAIAQLPVV